MSISYDCHLHTDFSTDSSTPMESQLQQAKRIGLKGVCITDHMDYDFPEEEYPHAANPFVFDPVPYQKQIKGMQKKFPELEIFTGVECGLQNNPHTREQLNQLMALGNWDFRIGSVHLIDGRDPYSPAFWEDRDPVECLRLFFEQTYENILSFHDFDSLGHLDYAVRYAPADYQYRPEAFMDIVDAILAFLVKKDIALEVNTSGLKTAQAAPNPHWDILRRYVQSGGRLITLGSDAHSPEYVGYRFSDMAKKIREIGLQEYVVYQNCRPVFYEI